MLKQLIILISLISLGTSCTAGEKTASLTVKDVGSLHFITATFKADEHKLKFCGDYLCVIDDTLFFGSDGKKPNTITKRFFFKINGNNIDLNITGMFEPGVTPENISQRINVEPYWGDFYKVAGRFSDGGTLLFSLINTGLSLANTAGNVLARQGDEIWHQENIGKVGNKIIYVSAYFIVDPYRKTAIDKGWLIHEEREEVTLA